MVDGGGELQHADAAHTRVKCPLNIQVRYLQCLQFCQFNASESRVRKIQNFLKSSRRKQIFVIHKVSDFLKSINLTFAIISPSPPSSPSRGPSCLRSTRWRGCRGSRPAAAGTGTRPWTSHTCQHSQSGRGCSSQFTQSAFKRKHIFPSSQASVWVKNLNQCAVYICILCLLNWQYFTFHWVHRKGAENRK